MGFSWCVGGAFLPRRTAEQRESATVLHCIAAGWLDLDLEYCCLLVVVGWGTNSVRTFLCSTCMHRCSFHLFFSIDRSVARPGASSPYSTPGSAPPHRACNHDVVTCVPPYVLFIACCAALQAMPSFYLFRFTNPRSPSPSPKHAVADEYDGQRQRQRRHRSILLPMGGTRTRLSQPWSVSPFLPSFPDTVWPSLVRVPAPTCAGVGSVMVRARASRSRTGTGWARARGLPPASHTPTSRPDAPLLSSTPSFHSLPCILLLSSSASWYKLLLRCNIIRSSKVLYLTY